MQHGVCMQKFLSISRLRLLYRSIGRDQYAYKLLTDAAHGHHAFYLYDVKNLLERLLENRYEQIYALDDAGADEPVAKKTSTSLPPGLISNDIDETVFPKPFRELFIWAVMLDRTELARFLWERGDSPVLTALLATKLFDSMHRLAVLSNTQLAERYRQFKR
jgi:transient receptor potential cation channel subfamily M protein 2